MALQQHVQNLPTSRTHPVILSARARRLQLWKSWPPLLWTLIASALWFTLTLITYLSLEQSPLSRSPSSLLRNAPWAAEQPIRLRVSLPLLGLTEKGPLRPDVPISQTDAQHARALRRAAQLSEADATSKSSTSTPPFLLLVTISSTTEITWARKWTAASTLSSPTPNDPLRHFIFLTHDKEAYEELETLDPGCVILQSAEPSITPSPALAWPTFRKLLTYKVSVAIAHVDDLSMLVAGNHILRQHWPDECDVLMKGEPPEWDVVAVRFSNHTANNGLDFLEAFRDCHAGQRRASLGETNPKVFGPASETKRTMTKAECLAHLKSRSMDVSDPANQHTSIDENYEYFRVCHAIDAPELAHTTSRALSVTSAPYDMIKQMIAHSTPIDSTLHMVLTISNAAGYTSRYKLARDFIDRIEMHDNDHAYVALYVMELAYGNQTHSIAKADHPRHLQLRAPVPLWHKENLINLAVERLLPEDWKAMAWIDADIEFESPSWALDTLRLFGSGAYDLVQLFSHGIDLDASGRATTVYTGFGHNYLRQIPYQKTGADMWHPGYAWACTREAYDQIGGLFEGNILGGGDQSTAYAILGMHATIPDTLKIFPSPGYKKAILEWERRFQGLRLGYVPGVVKHHFHGSTKNRQYWHRRDLLADAAFDPLVHLQREAESGVLVPTKVFPAELAPRILEYFASRKEDEDGGKEGRLTQANTVSDLRSILQNGAPVHTRLHVLVLIPPPPLPPPTERDTLDAKAYNLLVVDYLQRLSSTYRSPHLELYLVEMAHGGQWQFYHTVDGDPTHLQIRLPVKGIWSKGNVLNLAMDNLLPKDWQAMAYIDVGTEFDSLTWPQDTLRLLTEDAFDVLQLFSHAVHMNAWGNTTRIWNGFGYNSAHGFLPMPTPSSGPPAHWYPGLAWAYARNYIESASGRFFEADFPGTFDEIQAWSLLGAERIQDGNPENIFPQLHSSDVQEQRVSSYVAQWRQPTRVGYVPGVVRQVDALVMHV